MKMSSSNEGLTRQRRPGLLWDPEVDGRSTSTVPKESTSKPQKEVKMAESKLDVEKVSDLLNILDGTRDMPELKVIFDEALRELVEMARELREELEAEKEEKAA